MGSVVIDVSKIDGMDEEMKPIISSLSKEKGWFVEDIYKYEGFWCEKAFIYGSLITKRSFIPNNENVILATFPKAGTTWFSCLLYTTMNRTRYDFANHPLITKSPRVCVPHMEFEPFKNYPSNHNKSDSSSLMTTHLPYSFLPESVITKSSCKIVYVCRDPLDVFVSLLHNANEVRPQNLPSLGLDEGFDLFCKGIAPGGSIWDHVLGYWNASLQNPDNVCFLRYEDMKKQPILVLKKAAQFIGCPFSTEEEQDGMVQKIVDFCSFKSLASYQVNYTPVNKGKTTWADATNNVFFRKGKIGDHKNHLTDEMVKRLKDIINVKFEGSGLDAFVAQC